MTAEALLRQISDYCSRTGMAESTFGRRAVNDGKFASRLRSGGRATLETAQRVSRFMESNGSAATPASMAESDPSKNFRFYDNRQKYLTFVNTCSEKWVVAERVALELGSIHPRLPAVRIFDAGVGDDAGLGDGTVLARVMRSMHERFRWMPFYVVGKEISLEDARLALEKMPDRFREHPPTVLVMANWYYGEAPRLTPNAVAAATSLVWEEVALRGDTAAEFEEQITALQPFLTQHWRASINARTGNPVYDKRSCSCSTERTNASRSTRRCRAGEPRRRATIW